MAEVVNGAAQEEELVDYEEVGLLSSPPGTLQRPSKIIKRLRGRRRTPRQQRRRPRGSPRRRATWGSTLPASRTFCSSRSSCARSWTAGSSTPQRVRARCRRHTGTPLQAVLGSLSWLVCGAVQHECIPQAILGMDVLCQAKSGMGKTAVFVLSVLQQLEPEEGKVGAIVICHTRELAFQARLPPVAVCCSASLCQLTRRLVQICHEFERFATYMPSVKVANFFGGFPIKSHQELLKKDCPTVIVGTPGRLCQVLQASQLPVLATRHSRSLTCMCLCSCCAARTSAWPPSASSSSTSVTRSWTRQVCVGSQPAPGPAALIWCSQLTGRPVRADMRSDVQNIFKSTPHSKQVMMFSATLSKDIRPVCKKFMNDVRPGAGLREQPVPTPVHAAASTAAAAACRHCARPVWPASLIQDL